MKKQEETKKKTFPENDHLQKALDEASIYLIENYDKKGIKYRKRDFPDDDSYQEYKKLGGKSSEKEYFKNHDIFIDETLDIFTTGNPIKHNSRNEALQAVMKIAKISVKELNLIFDSVDNITSYG